MTVNGSFSQSGGSFVGGTGARTVNGAFSLTGGSFTSTSGDVDGDGELRAKWRHL